MEFFEKFKRLAKEYFQYKGMKRYHPVVAVLISIPLLFVKFMFIMQLASGFFLSILLFFIESPIEYLHNIIRKERKEVRETTELVLYFLSWPFIFFLYSVFALSVLNAHLVYFWAMLFGYAGGLGGYKFHLSMNEEDISKDIAPRAKKEKPAKKAETPKVEEAPKEEEPKPEE